MLAIMGHGRNETAWRRDQGQEAAEISLPQLRARSRGSPMENIGLPVSAQRLHTRDIKVDVLALLGLRLPTDSVCYDVLVKIKALIG